MSLDVFDRRCGVTVGQDVRSQTRPDAGKVRGTALSATGIRRRWMGLSYLAPPRAPDSIPMAYANQLTTGAAVLQSS